VPDHGDEAGILASDEYGISVEPTTFGVPVAPNLPPLMSLAAARA
jgi:hypothetical protein